MTQEEKQELLVALCGYLPYGLKFKTFKYTDDENKVITVNTAKAINYNSKQIQLDTFNNWSEIDWWKPYLRPMSSMTEEERKKLREILCWDFAPEDCPIFEHDFSVTTFYSYNEREENKYYDMKTMLSYFEFLNSHHFDYHGLIEKGLALEAPEDMYKN